MKKKVYLFSATPHPDAKHINSLDFDFYKPKIEFSNYDYLVLTSKKAVDALEQYEKKDYIRIPALCISKFTKEYYESFGGNILEVGGGIGSELQNIINQYPKDKKWLYIRAKEIAGGGLDVDEVILYESRCSDEILNFRLSETKGECSLIFTSPSSVRCFLKNNVLPKDAEIIVIGKTTAKSLPKGTKYIVAKKNSIQECINIALVKIDK